VYGLPVATVNREEGPAYGAALLAAVGAGAYSDLTTATQATLTRGTVLRPDSDRHRAYNVAYARFQRAFTAARPDRL
jgi:xylulokinase